MKGKIVYTPKGKQYTVDGAIVSKAEYERLFPDKEAGTGKCGDSPWRHHESLAAGVPPHCVEERRRFIKEMGLTGIEVRDNGRVKASSDKAFERYIGKLGFGNFSGTRNDY